MLAVRPVFSAANHFRFEESADHSLEFGIERGSDRTAVVKSRPDARIKRRPDPAHDLLCRGVSAFAIQNNFDNNQIGHEERIEYRANRWSSQLVRACVSRSGIEGRVQTTNSIDFIYIKPSQFRRSSLRLDCQ
jgi:hypothetical protein